MMVSENLKIEIRPIPNRGNIRELSKNLEHFAQAHIVSPVVDPVSMRYQTGLSKEDVEMLMEKRFPYVIEDVFKQGTAHEFWESQIIKVALTNAPIFLYPGKNLLDFVKYKFLLVSPFVYTSEAEIKTGSKPMATHYIYNEEEETEVKASRIAKQTKLLTKVSELSLERKRQLVLIMNDEDTETKSDSYLDVRISEIVENAEKRRRLEDLLSLKTQDIDVQAMIKLAVKKNVLRKTRKGYFYFDTNLGLAEVDVVRFLSDAENQEVYIAIKSNL